MELNWKKIVTHNYIIYLIVCVVALPIAIIITNIRHYEVFKEFIYSVFKEFKYSTYNKYRKEFRNKK